MTALLLVVSLWLFGGALLVVAWSRWCDRQNYLEVRAGAYQGRRGGVHE